MGTKAEELAIPAEVTVKIRKELLEIPEVLQQMWEEGRPLYDALVRRAHWQERPVFMLGNGPDYPAALSGAWAFESLLGMPVVVQRPAAFNAYTSRTLSSRSLVIALDGATDCEETLAAAQKGRSRGAIVWAVTGNVDGELAALADATVNDFSAGPASEGFRSVFCRHAALIYLALAAARVLKAPGNQLNAQEAELGKLARHAEWILDQIADAGAALAKEMRRVSSLEVTGGGAFFPIALQAAGRLRQTAGIPATGSDLLDFRQSFRRLSQPDSGILYFSSSRCGLKAQAHQSASEVRQKGKQKIFAITDGNDRQLSERADMAVLLPVLTEACGALLTFIFLEVAAAYAANPSSPDPARRRQTARS